MKGMYSKLPHAVYLKNERFIINTDFRIFIDFVEEMQGVNKQKAINKALSRFYYPAFFDICKNGLLDEAIEKFIWFYECGKGPTQKKAGKGKNKRGIFSYKYDDLFIWGAFNMYFKNEDGKPIDLTKDHLHWWMFNAMWLSLPNDCEFSKIKGYRSYTGKDKEILELKEFYSLPPTEQEKTDRIRRDKIYESLK